MKLTLKFCGLMLGLVFVGGQVARGMEGEEKPKVETAMQRQLRMERAAREAEEQKIAALPPVMHRLELKKKAAAEARRKEEEELRRSGDAYDQEGRLKALRAVESRRIKTAQEALDFELEGRGKMAHVVSGPEDPVSIFDVGTMETAQHKSLTLNLAAQAQKSPLTTFVNWEVVTTPSPTRELAWEGTTIKAPTARLPQPIITPHAPRYFEGRHEFSQQINSCATAALQLALVITFPGVYEQGATSIEASGLMTKPSILLYRNYNPILNRCFKNVLTLIQNLLDQSGDYSRQSVRHIVTEYMFSILNVANEISQSRAVVVADETAKIAADGPRDISPKEKNAFAARGFIPPSGYEVTKIYEETEPVQWHGQEVMRYSFEHAILELTHYFVFEYMYRFFCNRELYATSFITDQAFVKRYLFTGLNPEDPNSENFLTMKRFIYQRIFTINTEKRDDILFHFTHYLENMFWRASPGSLFLNSSELPGGAAIIGTRCGEYFSTSLPLPPIVRRTAPTPPPTKLGLLKAVVATLQRNLTAISQKLTQLKAH